MARGHGTRRGCGRSWEGTGRGSGHAESVGWGRGLGVTGRARIRCGFLRPTIPPAAGAASRLREQVPALEILEGLKSWRMRQASGRAGGLLSSGAGSREVLDRPWRSSEGRQGHHVSAGTLPKPPAPPPGRPPARPCLDGLRRGLVSPSERERPAGCGPAALGVPGYRCPAATATRASSGLDQWFPSGAQRPASVKRFQTSRRSR